MMKLYRMRRLEHERQEIRVRNPERVLVIV
jgi:hypothetical protein